MVDSHNFTWVQTHKEIVPYLKDMKDRQPELISELEKAGVDSFTDRDADGETFKLDEIEPFTFFFYINKYGEQRRLQILQNLARNLGISVPQDVDGVPTANATSVRIFPQKEIRTHNEINRLWTLFHKAVNHSVTDDDFQDALSIVSLGKTKLSEALFMVDPEYYLCINGQTRPYLKEVLGIDPEFKTYDEYMALLQRIRNETDMSFPELSFTAWELNKTQRKTHCWIFQCNPDKYDIIGALNTGLPIKWRVMAHKDKIHLDDKVILWVSGLDSGCYALATVTSEVERTTSEYWEQTFHKDKAVQSPENMVEITITHNLAQRPIMKSQISGIKELKDLKAGLQGTNFAATLKQYQTLESLAMLPDRKAIASSQSPLPILPLSLVSMPTNLILYGPPGTGKTYHSVNKALEIVDPGFMKAPRDRTQITERYRELVDEGRIVFTTFHQSMSYEDFIEGIKPIPNDEQGNNLSYEVEAGIFKHLCRRAAMSGHNNFYSAYTRFMEDIAGKDEKQLSLTTPFGAKFVVRPNSNDNLTLILGNEGRKGGSLTQNIMTSYILGETAPSFFKGYYLGVIEKLKSDYGLTIGETAKRDFVLIIDEINRGNVSQIFGELITLIEQDKRAGMPEALEVTLPYSKEKFSVPANLHIIGTMNTADRSVEALDTALRRRFSFCEMSPDYSLLRGSTVHGLDLGDLLETINQRIEGLLDRDHAIGHSYFLKVKLGDSTLKDVFLDEIIPLLQEYFYGNFGRIELVLGHGFVRSVPVTQSLFAVPSPDNDEFGDHVRYTLIPHREMDDPAFAKALQVLMKHE